jgi:hypothetical protein
MSLLGIKVYNLPQPVTSKKVIELGVFNFFGRWMRRKNWGGFTLPLPGVVLILYWLTSKEDMVSPFVRVHEFVHVLQDQGNAFWLVSWVRYFWFTFKDGGYWKNRLEVTARDVTDTAYDNGLPEWALRGWNDFQ